MIRDSGNLSRQNQTIRDKMGVVYLFNPEEAQQYALMAKKKVMRFGSSKPSSRCVDTATQRSASTVPSYQDAPSGQKIGQGTTTTPRNGINNMWGSEKHEMIKLAKFEWPNTARN